MLLLRTGFVASTGQCRPTAQIGLRRALTLWPERRSRSARGPDRYCKAPGEIGIKTEPAPILSHSGSAAGDRCLWERAPPGPLAMRGERKSSYAIQSAIQSFTFPGFRIRTCAVSNAAGVCGCDNGGEPIVPG